jgi:hypothetical protein
VKPLKATLKINVDASFDADVLRGITGAVINGSFGNFVVARNSNVEHVHDAMSAQAHAMKQGLILV